MVRMYVRIRCPLDEAMRRYGRWIARPEVEPARVVPERKMIDLALTDGDWKGLAVFVYPSGEWSVIEEVVRARPAAARPCRGARSRT